MSLIAWMRPGGWKLDGPPSSRWLLIGCLSFLAILSPAENLELQSPTADAPANKSHAGNASATSQFEQPPQKIDVFRLEQLEHQASENREQARKRIKVPQEALASQAVVDPASLPNEVRAVDPQAAPHWRIYEGVNQGLLAMVLVTAAGILVARKLVPEFSEWINATLNPWTMSHTVEFTTSVIAQAEEKSFSEFQARFRTGMTVNDLAAHLADREAEAEFFASANHHIERIQSLVKEARLSTIEAAQRKLLREAYDKFAPLQSLVANPTLKPLEQMACAMELLLKQLAEKAGTITSSTLRTATRGMEVLAELCQPEIKHEVLTATPMRFLVVDDEMFSRLALSTALKRTLTPPEIAEDVDTALALVARQTYDLIFLDVMMPGLDGFELCAKIHETASNRLTPVVFVTSLRDFDTRAKSIVCGARDIISKPFLTFELTVKALTLVTRERLKSRSHATDTVTESTAADALASPMIETSRPAMARTIAAKPAEASASIRSSPKRTRVFLKQAKAQTVKLRELLDTIERTSDVTVQRKLLNDLYAQVHSFALGAEACQQHALSQIGSALAGLLKKLLGQSGNLPAPTLQTSASALSLLQDLCADESDLSAISKPIDVLAVDDDPIARRYMANALQLKFLLPQSAADGKTAIELATTKPFDVIFLDVQMPDFDGFTVCKQIRQSALNRNTPVVFVTSHLDPAMKAKALACQGNDFISKPYICSELTVKTVTAAFRSRLSHTNAPETPVAA